MTVKLGSSQQGVLEALYEHKRWFCRQYGPGWHWGSTSQTLRILESLKKRGLVDHDIETGDFTVSERGLAHLKLTAEYLFRWRV